MFVTEETQTFCPWGATLVAEGLGQADLLFFWIGEEILHTPAAWDKERGKERIIKQCIQQYSKSGKLKVPVLYH